MEAFKALFHPQPGYKILDITAHADALTRMLAETLGPVGGRLSLVTYPGMHEPISEAEGMTLKRQSVGDFDRPFRALPRDNDIVFIRDVLHRHAQPERILRAIYTTLGNAVEVVIVTRRGEADPQEQLDLLEKVDFRAGNVIDDLIDDSVVVIGKKMHMWGKGL
jgi:hypothetical protein